jgi:hypothetical protein
MSSPSSLTSSGFVKPKAAMLLAIWRICLLECVLELRGLGLIWLIDIACIVMLFSLNRARGGCLASVTQQALLAAV